MSPFAWVKEDITFWLDIRYSWELSLQYSSATCKCNKCNNYIELIDVDSDNEKIKLITCIDGNCLLVGLRSGTINLYSLEYAINSKIHHVFVEPIRIVSWNMKRIFPSFSHFLLRHCLISPDKTTIGVLFACERKKDDSPIMFDSHLAFWKLTNEEINYLSPIAACKLPDSLGIQYYYERARDFPHISFIDNDQLIIYEEIYSTDSGDQPRALYIIKVSTCEIIDATKRQ
jgi:hypothetical protein